MFNSLTVVLADPKLLFKAVAKGDIDAVSHLLNSGEDANAVVLEYGITPLHLASYKGNFEIVVLLLNRGADGDAKDESGETPLHTASNNNQYLIAKLLIENSATVNVRTNQGWAPLHFAAAKGSEDIVKLLIEHGANIGSTTNIGKTPLNWAAENGHKRIVKLLNNALQEDASDLFNDAPGEEFIKTDDTDIFVQKSVQGIKENNKGVQEVVSTVNKIFSSVFFDGFGDPYILGWKWCVKTLPS